MASVINVAGRPLQLHHKEPVTWKKEFIIFATHITTGTAAKNKQQLLIASQ